MFLKGWLLVSRRRRRGGGEEGQVLIAFCNMGGEDVNINMTLRGGRLKGEKGRGSRLGLDFLK